MQLGTELRERYFQPQCAEQRCLQQLSHGRYEEEDVLVRSSGLARTLASAQSVLAGLYPPNTTAASLQEGLPLGVQVGSDYHVPSKRPQCQSAQDGRRAACHVAASFTEERRREGIASAPEETRSFKRTRLTPVRPRGQVIPVYSQPPADDVLLRAYDKCPALGRSMRAWHASAAFSSREASSAPLRETVGAAMGLAATPTLEEWYNTYDWLQLRQLGELQATEAAAVPMLEPAVWAQVRPWRCAENGERERQ